MHARWLSFVVWALLAASLAYWVLTLSVKGPQAPANARAATTDSAPADWTRLFASAQAQTAPVESASARYQLLGVVAPTAAGQHPGEGVALIAVAGALPKSVRIGQVVDGDLKLVEINRRDVGLGADGAVSVRLSLAPGAAGAPTPGQPAVGMSGGPMSQPPGFGGPSGPPQLAPGSENMVVPTQVGGSLPVAPPPGDGSANPLK
ncbi:type II secretion system protein N [Roseateles chitosanitabidus]|jgi:hypothetical protein|uniref:type II secretion system protein N n=1 Tax=Roseateles chitosanitabidus TaxID=65048 RepID=UPI00082C16D9|nr:type II secretion system protein N [Roseateles chitosanitabidus]MBO9686960.1 hypothetical protein [Roseateles chitosanitabidus]